MGVRRFSRLVCGTLLGAGVVWSVCLIAASPGSAANRDVVGRVFSLGTIGLDIAPGTDANVPGDALAVTSDWTIWAAQSGYTTALWRLRPLEAVARRMQPGDIGASVAAEAGGGLLLVAEHQQEGLTGSWSWGEVLRREAAGQLSAVAGQRADETALLGADGVPATEVALCRPDRVTALPRGAFAVHDGSGWVRRGSCDGCPGTGGRRDERDG